MFNTKIELKKRIPGTIFQETTLRKRTTIVNEYYPIIHAVLVVGVFVATAVGITHYIDHQLIKFVLVPQS